MPTTTTDWWTTLGLTIDSSPLEQMHAPHRAAARAEALREIAPLIGEAALETARAHVDTAVEHARLAHRNHSRGEARVR